MRLEGKTALITGATSGIGEETARAFAREGASLLLTGRSTERGERLREELSGVDTAFVSAELGTAAVAQSLVDETVRRFGRIDVLVNSAGVARHATVPETTDELWEDTITVNVHAVFYLCRAAVPVMIGAGGGVIVNVASTWGLVGAERTAAYCASKGAVILLTRSMALDHAKENVRINAVCPGGVDTPMLLVEAEAFGITPEEGRRRWAEDAPNKRLATADDIAESIVFLACDQSRHIHGISLPVDGGAIAGY